MRVVSGILLALTLCAWPSMAAPAPAARGGHPVAIAFEPNQGQADPAVRFLARGRGYGLFLTSTESVLVLAPGRPPSPGSGAGAPTGSPAVVRMRMVGAEPGATIAGVEPRPGRHHYLVGGAEGWRRSVPAFARVRYTGVYPGIDLVFYGTERELEFDFVVAPGADPAAVVLAFEGAERLEMDDDGHLVLTTSLGELRLRRPAIYQERDGGRQPVAGGYVLDGDRVRFRVAAWDAARALVIDPVLGYSTFLGGVSNDQGFGIAVDGAGNAYVTGSTISSNFPVSTAPAQPARAGVTDAFVARIGPTGALLYSTFLGGNGDDAGHAIALDSAGNAYVAGTTNSTNFPVRGAFQSTLRGGNDGFVVKLDPTGSALVYATYLGGNAEDVASGIALDGAGNAYVTGATSSAGFPNNGAVACLNAKSTGSDAFVVRLDTAGATLGYCRFLGGTGIDGGQGIAADGAGNVWVVGTTTSSAIGVQGPVQATPGGRTDAFVGKLDPGGAVVYLTFLGGSGDDLAFAVAVDGTGNAYVTGTTDSVNFPTVAPLQPSLGGGDDAFVARLNAAGSAAVFATYLGGVDDEAGNGIAIHPGDGSVYVAGATASIDFPTVAPIQPGLAGRVDAFVARLSGAGGALMSSTFLGGAGDDVAQAIAVDGDGIVYVTGGTSSAGFPTATPIQGAGGLLDAFVTQIVEGGIIQFTASGFQVSENGGSATISVQRTGDTSAPATVQFATGDGSATAGLDYTATSGTLTFQTGEITRTFTVAVLFDTLCDGDETVNLTLSTPGGGSVLGSRNSSTLTILEPASCINFTAAAYQVSENQGSALVTVARSGSAVGVVTVLFSTSDGTATAPADYTAVVNRTLTFGAGVRSVTAAVPLVNDTALEGLETVNLTLANVQGPATLGVRATATLDILDQDLGGAIQFSTAVYTVSEGVGLATITLIRTGSTAGGATVDFATSDGTATAGADYTATAGTVTFLAGRTTATFTVPITDDGSPEDVETVNLTLSNPGPSTTLGPRTTAVLRLVDNELALGLSATTYAVRESGGGATITVELAGVNATPVTVDWSTSDGSALAGSDYGVRGSVTPPAGTLTFPAGGTATAVRTRTFRVPVLQDTLLEDTETVSVTLSNPVGAQLVAGRDTATLSITDDDVGGTVQFTAAAYTVSEGVGTATITVSRAGGTAGGATVDYATSDGTATAGADYTAAAGTVTFVAGQTSATFTVTIADDGAAEGVETVNLTLSNPGPNATTKLGARTTAVLRVIDNELALAFAVASYAGRENGGVATITVELTGANATPVTVDWSTSDGSALAGSDYGVRGSVTPPSGTLTFAPGGTATTVRTRSFAVAMLQDTLVEGTESAGLALASPTGALLVAGRDSATLLIVDDDLGGIVQFSAAVFSATECAALPCNATLTLSRTGGAASAVTVDFVTADGTATAGVDYAATSGTVTFAAGQTSQPIRIPLLTEVGAEAIKSFTVIVSNPQGGGSLGARTSAEVRITDPR